MELRKLIDVLYISLFLTLAKQPKTCERRLSLSMYIYIYIYIESQDGKIFPVNLKHIFKWQREVAS